MSQANHLEAAASAGDQIITELFGRFAIYWFLIIVGPTLTVLFGTCGGWILTWTPMASWAVAGAQLFGIQLTVAQFPVAAGFLAWFASYFRSALTPSKSKT